MAALAALCGSGGAVAPPTAAAAAAINMSSAALFVAGGTDEDGEANWVVAPEAALAQESDELGVGICNLVYDNGAAPSILRVKLPMVKTSL